MWSWVAHRVTGVLIFFFLFAHVMDTALVRVSPDAYNTVIGTYKNPVVGLGEAGLVAAVIFHALNGVRIMLVDFWRNIRDLQVTSGGQPVAVVKEDSVTWRAVVRGGEATIRWNVGWPTATGAQGSGATCVKYWTIAQTACWV